MSPRNVATGWLMTALPGATTAPTARESSTPLPPPSAAVFLPPGRRNGEKMRM